ncbi:hypothetical protein [Litorivivens sp.]|uniref:hypothetical protein n=1 Tax=Litorivivens sp. TaxID=2020868 RepID=UPI0035674ED9
MKPSDIIRLGKVCLLAASIVSQSALAQPSSQDLSRLQARQAELQEEIQSLREQSVSLSQQMANTEPSDGPEKAAYDEAVAGFEEASEQYETDPTPTNKSRLRNAEFKMHLAERKFRSANSQLRQLEAKQDGVESELIRVRRELERVEKRIPEMKREIAAYRERQQAEAARRAEAEARNRAQANNNQPSAAEKPVAKAETKAKSEPDNKVASSNEPLELDRDFTLLTSRAQVLTELANLQLRIGGDGLKIRSNKILNVRHFVNGQEVEKNSDRFKGLGNYQYRANTVIQPGENRIRVSFFRWNIEMPEEFGGQEMVILMDASDRDAPRIIAYPESLDS